MGHLCSECSLDRIANLLARQMQSSNRLGVRVVNDTRRLVSHAVLVTMLGDEIGVALLQPLRFCSRIGPGVVALVEVGLSGCFW